MDQNKLKRRINKNEISKNEGKITMCEEIGT